MICSSTYMASSECHCNGTCIQQCHKHERISVAHFPVEFVAILGLPSASAYSSHIQYYNTPRDHIPQGRVVEHCPNLLHAQIFAYKGYSLRRHEFATTLNDLFMSMPALFKYTRTCVTKQQVTSLV
jgi:hypothetical protein